MPGCKLVSGLVEGCVEEVRVSQVPTHRHTHANSKRAIVCEDKDKDMYFP